MLAKWRRASAYLISRCFTIVGEETPIALSVTNRKQLNVSLKIAHVSQRTLSGTSRRHDEL